tara:strand:+ start:1086 stop:1259 length:174 start_codon:yes stop_codon:yes gene_type:complete
MFKMKAAIRPNQRASKKLRFKEHVYVNDNAVHNKQNSPPNVLINVMRKLKEKLFALG